MLATCRGAALEKESGALAAKHASPGFSPTVLDFMHMWAYVHVCENALCMRESHGYAYSCVCMSVCVNACSYVCMCACVYVCTSTAERAVCSQQHSGFSSICCLLAAEWMLNEYRYSE